MLIIIYKNFSQLQLVGVQCFRCTVLLRASAITKNNTPDNAGLLLSMAHIDGALVGGASLKADDFAGIVLA